jgi:acetyltransferase-like isoleucine patch superfamily enzyme
MAIVSPNVRIRVPEHFHVGEDSVVDDYCYFSTRVRIGRGSHIANNCSVAGGPEWQFVLGDFSSLSAGVRVWCASNDFARDVIAITSEEIGDEQIRGDVTIGDFTGVGANAVIMPRTEVPEGVAIGALSFVPPAYDFEPWTVYAGIPVRPVAHRDRDRVMRQVEALLRRPAQSA